VIAAQCEIRRQEPEIAGIRRVEEAWRLVTVPQQLHVAACALSILPTSAEPDPGIGVGDRRCR
jgi:hypothetical protein